ncbi:S-type pyocin family protein [Brevundimonas sp. FT23042]|uniref:S-type pyocin family protein n=1 Tax=Brevundimonas sp. FT23042 TaxID=3393749 RepID=UPI003B588E92
MRKAMMIAAVGAALGIGSAGLAGCGDGGSAVETRERTTADAPSATGGADGAAATPAASVETSRPVLTANRRETVDAKVARLFERNGADFGARTAEDYLARVEAFTTRPPPDVDRVERPNGDVLLYQASTNTFAVVSRDGVPKTMFKPRDGAAYWAEQKAAAPDFGRRQSAS